MTKSPSRWSERGRSDPERPDGLSELLVRVLAAADAVFLPIRAAEWQSRSGPAVWFARQQFRRLGGVQVAIGGSDRHRKAGQRLIDHAITAGLLTARRRGRTRFLKLADGAEDELRQRCGLPGLWLAFETVRRMPVGVWVPEVELNGGKGWGDPDPAGLRLTEMFLLPALVRGLADSGSTCRGHVYYRRLADSPAWPVPVEDREPDPGLARLYAAELPTERERVILADVGRMEVGELPLAMGTRP